MPDGHGQGLGKLGWVTASPLSSHKPALLVFVFWAPTAPRPLSPPTWGCTLAGGLLLQRAELPVIHQGRQRLWQPGEGDVCLLIGDSVWAGHSGWGRLSSLHSAFHSSSGSHLYPGCLDRGLSEPGVGSHVLIYQAPGVRLVHTSGPWFGPAVPATVWPVSSVPSLCHSHTHPRGCCGPLPRCQPSVCWFTHDFSIPHIP